VKLQSSVIRLEAWLQEELAAQERMVELLERQEQAIRNSDDPGLKAAGKDLDLELTSQPRRAARRGVLLAELANAMGIAPTALTLSHVADHAEANGINPTRLRTLREEIRSAAANVLRRGRRVASLARYHQGLLSELMGVLFEDPERDIHSEEPRLLDAKA